MEVTHAAKATFAERLLERFGVEVAEDDRARIAGSGERVSERASCLAALLCGDDAAVRIGDAAPPVIHHEQDRPAFVVPSELASSDQPARHRGDPWAMDFDRDEPGEAFGSRQHREACPAAIRTRLEEPDVSGMKSLLQETEDPVGMDLGQPDEVRPGSGEEAVENARDGVELGEQLWLVRGPIPPGARLEEVLDVPECDTQVGHDAPILNARDERRTHNREANRPLLHGRQRPGAP
ncbi:hypothetical protein BE21_50720 [Sorangium cellulosum]|uniref:Uncharacterized protein n=1 Tax=Sorangium cellulosum TaxID=56 RepID=A0A150TFY6_SORCE|nr:hypothetical protein BE21_50720 [Sorangium cellulosum]